MGHGVMDAFGHLVHVEPGDGAVQGRGADEGVDAGAFRVAHGLPAAVDVLVVGPREAADRRVPGGPRDVRDSAEVAFGGDRKARFDDVDAHLVQKGGDFELFLVRHGGAG